MQVLLNIKLNYFLDHKSSNNGLEILTRKVDEIVNVPRTRDVGQLRSLLGVAKNYSNQLCQAFVCFQHFHFNTFSEIETMLENSNNILNSALEWFMINSLHLSKNKKLNNCP